jgi:hypothetical protein
MSYLPKITQFIVQLWNATKHWQLLQYDCYNLFEVKIQLYEQDNHFECPAQPTGQNNISCTRVIQKQDCDMFEALEANQMRHDIRDFVVEECEK